jgi:hypothetical protein
LTDEKDLLEKKKLSLSVANSLVLRLLEKRFLTHESAPEALTFFCEKCLSLLLTIKPVGYPCLKMAGDITGRLIEAGRLSNKDAVARHLEDHMLTLELIAATLPPEHKKEILKVSSDMVLKMLETVTLSGTSIPKVLGKAAENAARFLEGKKE